MKIITNFNNFLNEAPRLSDFGKIVNINNKETFDIMNDYQNDIFVDNDKLVDIIILPKSNKIVNIKWNDKYKHNLKERIEERTSCKSVSEFNELFSRMFKFVI